MHANLIKNFSFLSASSVLLPFTTMALVVAISRLGGVEMLGQYSLLVTFFFFGQTCSTAGLQILLTRDVARTRARAGAYLMSGTIIGFIAVVVISAILVPSFMWTVPGSDTRISLFFMAGSLFPTVVIAFAESVLLAFERAEDFVVVGLVESLARTIFGTALVLAGFGIVAIAANFLLCRIGAAWATMRRVRHREPSLSLAFDWTCFRELSRQIPVVGSIPVLNSLYWRLDTLLLTWLRGLVDVGYYSASTRILDITRNLPQAYARALYPLLSRLHHEDDAEFERLSRDSIVWIVVTTMPLALATFSLAPWIITILYGEHMSAAIRGLQITAWLIIPYALTNTLAQILFASGNQALDLRVNAAAVLANLTLNLALIPHFGFVGAASASLMSIMLHVSLQYRYVCQRIFDPAILVPLARIAVVGLVSCVLGTAGIVGGYHPLVSTGAELACYALGLWAVGIVHRDHLRTLRGYGATAVGKLLRDRSARPVSARHPPAAK